VNRTLNQNAALHAYCEQLAEALNGAGYDMKKVFEVKTAEVPWTQTSVKEALWKPVQQAMFEKESTAKLDTKEVSQVHKVLDKHIAENFGISIPFPSNEPPIIDWENY